MTRSFLTLLAYLTASLCSIGCNVEDNQAVEVCEEACVSLSVCNLGFDPDQARASCEDPSFAGAELDDCANDWEDCDSADRDAIFQCISVHTNTCQDQTLFDCIDAIACTGG